MKHIRFHEHSPITISAILTGVVLLGSCVSCTPELNIGMNLEPHSYYSREFPFLDFMKSCRPWVTQNASGWNPMDTGQIEHIDLDDNGYPLSSPVVVEGFHEPQIVATMIGTTGAYPAGRYV